MDIARIGGGSLERTAAAVRAGQDRFAEKAEDVVRAAEGQSQIPDAPPDSAEPVAPPAATAETEPDLARSAVALREESLMNQVLFATFKAQADQQKSLVSDLTGS
ncbi:MAG: hypothetical protein RLZZ127_80 [Planctomycetota bacterium]|jgi:hypothetical protein